MKSFVYKGVKPGGTYITSLDNDLAQNTLRHPSLSAKKIKKIGSTTQLSLNQAEQLQKTLDLFDVFHQDNNEIFSLRQQVVLAKLPGLEQDKALAINSLFALAGASCLPQLDFDAIVRQLNNFEFPEKYGRHLHYVKDNQDLFIDFAHEKDSLRLLTHKVYQQTGTKPYLIARISPDNSDYAIQEFAQALLSLPIKGATIYNKVDGVSKMIFRNRRGEIRQVGETVGQITAFLQKFSLEFEVWRIIPELEALEFNFKKNNFPLIHVYNNLPAVQSFISDEFELVSGKTR